MKKLIALVLALICALSLVGCNECFSVDDPDEEIYRAKDYAMAEFNGKMPQKYVIVSATCSVGDVVRDSIYDIKITYVIGDDGTHFYYKYKVLVDGENFTILEEGTD